jgi:hypothetical protein
MTLRACLARESPRPPTEEELALDSGARASEGDSTNANAEEGAAAGNANAEEEGAAAGNANAEEGAAAGNANTADA